LFRSTESGTDFVGDLHGGFLTCCYEATLNENEIFHDEVNYYHQHIGVRCSCTEKICGGVHGVNEIVDARKVRGVLKLY